MCNRSCFQWRYVGGNNWGVCADGKGKVGFYDEKIFVTAESQKTSFPRLDAAPKRSFGVVPTFQSELISLHPIR